VSDGEDSPRPEEIIALHQVAVSDIAFFKFQQWRVTNYGLLLYAAVIAISLIFKDSNRIEIAVLWILVLAVLIVGVIVLCQLEDSLRKGRDRLAELRLHFSKPAMKAWAAGKETVEAFREGEEKKSLLWLFATVFVVGFALDTWILCRSACAA
jgi:hypothetical protein